jgi:hypothetical protein
LTFVAGTAIDQCGNTSTTPYTLTATDDCGNFVTRYANLIITDETAPVFNAPTATNTVTCNGTVSATKQTWLNSATGTDACGGNVTTTYALINEVTSCVGTTTTITQTYLFTVSDECGNASTGTADFTITDSTAPVITAPEDLTIACGPE